MLSEHEEDYLLSLLQASFWFILLDVDMLYSEISEPFHEVIKLLSIDHSASVFVKLVVTLLKVILIPGLIFASSSHDLHNELS